MRGFCIAANVGLGDRRLRPAALLKRTSHSCNLLQTLWLFVTIDVG